MEEMDTTLWKLMYQIRQKTFMQYAHQLKQNKQMK